MDLGDLLMALVGGTVIGFLGKAVAGDRDGVPLWLTIVCGVGGVVVGTYLYGRVFEPATAGVDWWQHASQVSVATALVLLAATAVRRHSV